MTKYNILDALDNTNLLSYDSEGQIPESRYQQGWFLLKALGEGSVPNLFLWHVYDYLLLVSFDIIFPYICESKLTFS